MKLANVKNSTLLQTNQTNGNFTARKLTKSIDKLGLYLLDGFHSVVHQSLYKVLILAFFVYFFIVSLYAHVYLVISKNYGCNLEISTYTEAWAFSLESMATIGYGTADIFFGDCKVQIFALGSQVFVNVVVHAVIGGLIYCRLSNPQLRSSTIIFSNKAVIRRIRGKLYFMLQLCELRKHQLVDAHIRLYVVRRDMDYYDGVVEEGHDSNEPPSYQQERSVGQEDTAHFHVQTCSMRLNHPNDELGAKMLLFMPQIVVHEIDAWSPLMPPPAWISCLSGRLVRWRPPCYRFVEEPCTSEVELSERDNSADDVSNCIDASKGQYDLSALSKLYFPSVTSRASNLPDDDWIAASPGMKHFKQIIANESVHAGIDKEELAQAAARNITRQQKYESAAIDRFMIDRRMQIVVLLEGVDPSTGASVQVGSKVVSWAVT